MSNWSHVAAVVRVDHFPGDGLDFNSVFGKEIRFDDPIEEWENANDYPESYLPFGSEGSLHMSVWENPEPNHLARYTVTLFGDLRDHDSPGELVEWFRKKLDGLLIRQAVITVTNERFGTVSWVHGVDDKKNCLTCANSFSADAEDGTEYLVCAVHSFERVEDEGYCDDYNHTGGNV